MTNLFSKRGTTCSRCHLDALCATLSPGEIVDMTKVTVDQRLVGFPDDLPLPAGEQRWSWSI